MILALKRGCEHHMYSSQLSLFGLNSYHSVTCIVDIGFCHRSVGDVRRRPLRVFWWLLRRRQCHVEKLKLSITTPYIFLERVSANYLTDRM